MTVGKITSSQQDLVYVKVRPENGTFLETRIGGSETVLSIADSAGQEFTAEHYFSRIKIAVKDAGNRSLIARLYDSHLKENKVHETIFKKVGQDCVLHWAFDPLPAGTYYWEIETWTGVSGFELYVFSGSTLGTAYMDDSLLSGKDFKSKVMYCEDVEVERAVAVVGDSVDSGVTTVSSGTPFGSVMIGTVEKNISRELDDMVNGGKILTGSWFFEIDS
ncbi:hypothetical protein [uncultured Methanolobus sp.]|uniref:hypothetical protein n=1 Tax=uncultured Methanolobus sp. TaxID=218300 RepID=UPI0029C79BE3|nr:hypothetical protein [uncultured Methanolobus sp.]